MLNIPEEVKTLYRQPGADKNLRIHFPNGEHEDITNDNLISESFSFEESICSQDTLKFGLCEAGMVEFETIGVGNIKGCEIDVSMEVCYEIEDWNMAAGTANRFLATSTEYEETGYYIEEAITTEKRIAIAFDYEVVDESGSYTDKSQRLTIKIGKLTALYSDLKSSGTVRHVWTQLLAQDENAQITVKLTDPSYPVIISNLVVKYGDGDYDYPEWSIAKKDRCIPFGRFTVDTCPRQSDMSRRKVTAYTADMQNGIQFTDVEKAKQKSFLKSNTPYEVELIQFLFSNLKGLKFDDSYFDITQISMESASETVYSISGTPCAVTVEGSIISINPGDEMEKGLIRLDYNHVSGFKTIREEIMQELQAVFGSLAEGFSYALGPFVKLYEETFSTKLNLLGATNRKVVSADVESLIYPYISGKTDSFVENSRGYFNIILPKTLTIYNSGTTKQWTIAESVSAELLTPVEGLFNPVLSFERTKVADDCYNLQEKINLTGYVTAWLELNALFGKYTRDGGIELINLQKQMELFPSEYLYPSEDLYPVDYGNLNPTSELITEHEYMAEGFWYEEYQVQPFGKVIVDYKDMEENDQTFVYPFDPDAPNVYYMDNNEIFKTIQMAEADVKALLDTYFIPNANDTVFTPVELRMRGRPDIEAGDYLNIVSNERNVFTFVLRRTLTGIQNLIDEVEAECNEINEDITDTSLFVEGESS